MVKDTSELTGFPFKHQHGISDENRVEITSLVSAKVFKCILSKKKFCFVAVT